MFVMHSSLEIQDVLALSALGLPDVEVARRTGIPRSTVRDWRRGLIPGKGPDRRAKPCPICEPAGRPLPCGAYAYLLGLLPGRRLSQNRRVMQTRHRRGAPREPGLGRTEKDLSLRRGDGVLQPLGVPPP